MVLFEYTPGAPRQCVYRATVRAPCRVFRYIVSTQCKIVRPRLVLWRGPVEGNGGVADIREPVVLDRRINRSKECDAARALVPSHNLDSFQ